MEYILILMLISMVLLSYLIGRGDIISPWFISSCMYFLSSFVALVNLKYWGEKVHPITVLVIITGLISVGIGEISIKSVKLYKKNLQPKQCEIIIPFSVVLISFFLGSIIVYLSFRRLLDIAYMGGYTGSGYLLNYARIAIIHYNASWGITLGICQFFTTGVAYVFTFSFINNYVIYKGKKRAVIKYWYYILPIVPFIIIEIMSTGRSGFIRYISMIFFIGIILLKIKTGWKNNNNWRIVLIAIISLSLFYVLFIQLGNLTGKNSILNVRDSISIYTGGSIIALDKFLETPTSSKVMLGEETLYGIKYILNFIGFDAVVENRHLDFIYFNNGLSTNVYTALRRYIHDYGYLGMLIVQFLMGAFFALFYSFIKKRNSASVCIIIYAYLANALIMQSIDESFLSVFLSVSQIFSILFIIICYKVLIKKKYMKEYQINN